MSDIAAVSALVADARAVVAALEADDDPTLRQRLDAALNRLTKLEEAVALLMDDNAKDVPMAPPAGQKAEQPDQNTGITAAPESDEARQELADEGKAIRHDDGSVGFPIDNITDLHNAIRAIGRAKDPKATKRFIRKRARELGAEDELPDSWD